MLASAPSLAIFRRFHILREIITGILLAAVLLSTSYSQSPPSPWVANPSWWTTRGVLAPGRAADDYAVINQGQLKNIVRMAVAEMNLKLTGGAGSALNQMVSSWGGINNSADDFATVNLGQAKTVAAPIYERLLSAGVITILPTWVNATPQASDDNDALANIGQVKSLFSFTLPDQTSLPPEDVEIGNDNLSPFVISYSGWRSAEIHPRLSTDTVELPQVNKYRCVVQQYEWTPIESNSPYRPYKQLVTPEASSVLLSNLEEAVLWTGTRNQEAPKFLVTGTVVENNYSEDEIPGLQTVKEYEGSADWDGVGTEPALQKGSVLNSWSIVNPFGPYPSAVEQAWVRSQERKYSLKSGNNSWTEANFTNESYFVGQIPSQGIRATSKGPITSPLNPSATIVELATANPISAINSLPVVAYNSLALSSKGGLVATSTAVLSTLYEKYLDGNNVIDSQRYVGETSSGNVSIAWRTDWPKSLSYQEKLTWLNRYVVTTKTYIGNSEPQIVTVPLSQRLGAIDEVPKSLPWDNNNLFPGSQKVIELSVALAAVSGPDPGSPDPGSPDPVSNPPFTLSYQIPGKKGLGHQISYRNPRNKMTGESVPIYASDFKHIALGYSMGQSSYEMDLSGEWDVGVLDLLPRFRSFPYPAFGTINQFSINNPPPARYSKRERTLPREGPMHLPDSGDPNEVVDYTRFWQEERQHYIRIYSSESLPLGYSMTVLPIVSVIQVLQDPITGQTYTPENAQTQRFSLPAHTFIIPPNDHKSEPKEFEIPAVLEYSENRQISIVLFPIEFEVKHTEIEPATGQAVNPGAYTMLRDEIVDIRIKVPPIGNADWTVDLSVEPEAMRTQSLPNRGNVQMYDFGQIETNGTVTPDKTQFVLHASAGGERIIRAIFNKEGKMKVKMKSPDGKIDFTSPEFTILKRIRKYANLPSSQNHDLNQHDQAFIDAAAHWGGVYQHPVDDVERLKAMGMAESELGLTDATDIMTVGNPGDHVLDTFRNVSPYDRFPGVAPLGGLALREVDIANNTTKMLSYPAADETPAATAIHWGVCWLYQKASSIQNNPNPPHPPSPPNPYIPGPWRSWDTAVIRYGPPNAYPGGLFYLDRVKRPYLEGRHPSIPTLYLWPLKSNKKARGD